MDLTHDDPGVPQLHLAIGELGLADLLLSLVPPGFITLRGRGMGQMAKWFDGTIGAPAGATTPTYQLPITEFLRVQNWGRVVLQVLIKDISLGGVASVDLTWQGCVQADSKFLYDITQGGAGFSTPLAGVDSVAGPVRLEWGMTSYPKDGMGSFLGFKASPVSGLAAFSATIEIWVLLTDPV